MILSHQPISNKNRPWRSFPKIKAAPLMRQPYRIKPKAKELATEITANSVISNTFIVSFAITKSSTSLFLQ